VEGNSESSVAVCETSADVLRGLALEFEHCFLGLSEIFEGAFGTDIEAASWVGGPAVEGSVVEVVWVGVGDVLADVVAFSFEHVCGLEGERVLSRSLPISSHLVHNDDWATNEKAECWHENVPLGDHSVLELTQLRAVEGRRGHWLIETEVVVSWNAMVADDATKHLLHVTVS